jgi:hypothetical protein
LDSLRADRKFHEESRIRKSLSNHELRQSRAFSARSEKFSETAHSRKAYNSKVMDKTRDTIDRKRIKAFEIQQQWIQNHQKQQKALTKERRQLMELVKTYQIEKVDQTEQMRQKIALEKSRKQTLRDQIEQKDEKTKGLLAEMRDRERHRSQLRSERLKVQLENMQIRRTQDRRMSVNENRQTCNEDMSRRELVRKVRQQEREMANISLTSRVHAN